MNFQKRIERFQGPQWAGPDRGRVEPRGEHNNISHVINANCHFGCRLVGCLPSFLEEDNPT